MPSARDVHTSVKQAVKEPYRDWAEGHINRVKDILNASRTEHTQVVKDRIQSVEQMKDVVSVTEGLFALSKVRCSTLFPLSRPTDTRGIIPAGDRAARV